LGNTEKIERFEARITARQKELLKRAAELEGSTLTEFVMSRAQAAARATIREHGQLKMSLRDQEAFVRTLLNPPEPFPRLRSAYERHKDELR